MQLDLNEYFPVFTCWAVWLLQLAKWEHCQIFGKIWGNVPISSNIGDEAKNPDTGY